MHMVTLYITAVCKVATEYHCDGVPKESTRVHVSITHAVNLPHHSHWSTDVGGMAAIPGGRLYGMNGEGSSGCGGNTGNGAAAGSGRC